MRGGARKARRGLTGQEKGRVPIAESRGADTLVTVAVAVYDIAPYLERCFESVLGQTHEKIQFIIVDDGSTDESTRMCRECAVLDPRVLLVEQENGGVSRARNAALEHASGEYICFIDGDDYLEPDYVERLLAAALRDEADVVVCGYIVERDVIGCGREGEGGTGAGGAVMRDVRFEEGPSDEHGFWRTAMKDETYNVYVWNKLYKLSAIAGTRFIDGKSAQDQPFNLEVIARCKKLTFIADELYHYVFREKSVSRKASFSTNLDVFEFDMMLCDRLEQMGYYDCTVSVLHRVINQLARRHPRENDPGQQAVYDTTREYFDRQYRKELQRGTLPRSLRMRYRVFRLFGSRGYLLFSRIYQVLAGNRS